MDATASSEPGPDTTWPRSEPWPKSKEYWGPENPAMARSRAMRRKAFRGASSLSTTIQPFLAPSLVNWGGFRDWEVVPGTGAAKAAEPTRSKGTKGSLMLGTERRFCVEYVK